MVRGQGRNPGENYQVKCPKKFCTKFGSFQYKILVQAIITNLQLCKFGIKKENSCTFCLKQEETLRHLFYECDPIKQLWDKVYQLFTDIKINANNYENVILNVITDNAKLIPNFVVLLTKHIYCCCCQDVKPNFATLRKMTDLMYTSWNGQLSKHLTLKLNGTKN